MNLQKKSYAVTASTVLADIDLSLLAGRNVELLAADEKNSAFILKQYREERTGRGNPERRTARCDTRC